MATYLYLRTDIDGHYGVTTGFTCLGTYSLTSSGSIGHGARSFDSVKGNNQQHWGGPSATTGQTWSGVQFVSAPLPVGTVIGGPGTTVDVGFAIAGASSATSAIQGMLGVYVMNAAGTLATGGTLRAAAVFGSSITPANNAITTVYATGIALNSTPYTSVAGDRLVVECGIKNVGATTQTLHVYFTGGTAISSNNVTNADPAAFVNFSQSVDSVPNNAYWLAPSTAPPGTKPAGFIGTWAVKAAAGTNNGTGAGYLALTPPGTQVASATITSTSASAQQLGAMQFISDPLPAQTLAGTMSIGFGIQSGTAAAFSGYMKVMLLTSAGALRFTLYDGVVGVSKTVATTETGAYTEIITLTSQSVTAGDRLCIEIGGSTAATGKTIICYTGGAWNVQPDSANFSAGATSGSSVEFSALISVIALTLTPAATIGTSTGTLTLSGTALTITPATTVGTSSGTLDAVPFSVAPLYPSAADTFTRTNVVAGWGAATDGNAWAVDTGSAFAVTGGVGLVTGNASVNGAFGPVLADGGALITTSASAWGGLTTGLCLRYNDPNNLYRFYIDGAQLHIVKRVAGAQTTISSTSFAAPTATLYTIRAEAIGTTLRVKAWPAASAEPWAWIGTITDADLASGQIGVRLFPGTGNTITVTAISGAISPIRGTSSGTLSSGGAALTLTSAATIGSAAGALDAPLIALTLTPGATVGGSAGALSALAALTLSPAALVGNSGGTLLAVPSQLTLLTAAVVGTSAGTLSPGPTVLSLSTATVFGTTSGALQGLAALTLTSAATVGSTSGALQGLAALTLTPAATLGTSTGTLSTGSVALTLTSAAAIGGATGAVQGLAALTITPAATLGASAGTLSPGGAVLSLSAATLVGSTSGAVQGLAALTLTPAATVGASTGTLSTGAVALSLSPAATIGAALGTLALAGNAVVLSPAVTIGASTGTLAAVPRALTLATAGALGGSTGTLQGVPASLSLATASLVGLATGTLTTASVPLTITPAAVIGASIGTLSVVTTALALTPAVVIGAASGALQTTTTQLVPSIAATIGASAGTLSVVPRALTLTVATTLGTSTGALGVAGVALSLTQASSVGSTSGSLSPGAAALLLNPASVLGSATGTLASVPRQLTLAPAATLGASAGSLATGGLVPVPASTVGAATGSLDVATVALTLTPAYTLGRSAGTMAAPLVAVQSFAVFQARWSIHTISGTWDPESL